MDDDAEEAQLRLAIEMSLQEANNKGTKGPTTEHDWQDLAFFSDLDLNKAPAQKPSPNTAPVFDVPTGTIPDSKPNSRPLGDSASAGMMGKLSSFSFNPFGSSNPKPSSSSKNTSAKEAAPSLGGEKICPTCHQPVSASIFSVAGTVTTDSGEVYHSHCFLCGTCRKPINGQYTLHRGSSTPYHYGCFRCAGCNEQIQGPFVDHGEPPQPYHAACSKELFAPRCCLCSHALDGQFYRHSYFESEKYCLSHETRTSCFACGRKEPLPSSHKEGFVDLLDGRSLCAQCSSSIIVDSSEAAALYRDIVEYMGTVLGLPIPEGMLAVPVLVVDVHSLNENMSKAGAALGYHDAGAIPGAGQGQGGVSTGPGKLPAGSTVRGVTLSTCSEVRHFPSGSMAFNHLAGALRTGRMPAVFQVKEVRDVTAVLVLYGLPRDLTASILAHEAMHVWLKLNKGFPFRMPPKLEEGLCQVIAYLYLESLVQAEAHSKVGALDSAESVRQGRLQEQEQSLRRYFAQQIQNDPSPVYGEGFREAQNVVSALGLEVVLDFIQHNQALPQL